MFKVIAGDGSVFGLVDSQKAAEAIVEMKKLGRDGRKITSPAQATKASTMSFTIVQVPDSAHPSAQ